MRPGPVDLIRQDDLRHDGACPVFELAGLLVEYVDAGNIGGQEIGRELDAAESAAQRPRQRLRQRRLAHAGHVLQQDMAVGEESNQKQFDRRRLSDDDASDLLLNLPC